MASVRIGNVSTFETTLRANEVGVAAAKAKMVGVGGGGSFFFPYTPVNLTYSSVGAEYVQIERPTNYALVAMKAPNLLSVSFDFRVAHRPSNGLQPIGDMLDALKAMATADFPVSVTGIGGFVSSVAKFRILTLNVEIVTVSPQNEPWQANCSIELLEDRNPVFAATSFTPITYTAEVPATTAGGGGSGNGGGGNSDTPAPIPNSLRYSDIVNGRDVTDASGRIGFQSKLVPTTPASVPPTIMPRLRLS